MAGNSFGRSFRVTTFGESHGGAVGVVIDGAPPLLPLCCADIQKELDRRKPGGGGVASPRVEADEVQLLSGVFEGKTTGTPILLLVYNKDARSSDYQAIKDLFRPGHADYTYYRKYGIRDHRGSGRASGRETAGRVAAGAVAKKILAGRGVSILAYTLRAAGVSCADFDPGVIEANPLRACDAAAAREMEKRILALREQGDSAGGVVECRLRGVPPGLGEPVFDKLDAELAHAMLCLGAVKGIEFGAGFAAADMKGSEHNDAMNGNGFASNNAGGILGGISTGQEIIFRVAVKPTASISLPQKTLTTTGEEAEVSTQGRHDACICPRIVPVVEAMAAIVLEDHFRRYEEAKR